MLLYMEVVEHSEFDDSYILPEHKKSLLVTIKNIYDKQMPWADSVLLKCCVKEHYKEVIKLMNREKYLEEINKTDIDTLLDGM